MFFDKFDNKLSLKSRPNIDSQFMIQQYHHI